MKGIILAGGKGTRLYPLTKVISKQLLPVYDKPLIYYPLSVLMLAGIRQVLIISTGDDLPLFKRLLGDGSDFGIQLSYKVQEQPNGLAEAFLLGEEFIGSSNVCLILGDNIFFGPGFTDILKNCTLLKQGARVFGYHVCHPQNYGVIEFDETNKVLSIEEKPSKPKSHFIIPGLYFYDNTVVAKAKKLTPSSRGELEITDLNRLYLQEGTLSVQILGRGFAWLDTGTHQDLFRAANFVQTIQELQGLNVACLDEIALKNNWVQEGGRFGEDKAP